MVISQLTYWRNNLKKNFTRCAVYFLNIYARVCVCMYIHSLVNQSLFLSEHHWKQLFFRLHDVWLFTRSLKALIVSLSTTLNFSLRMGQIEAGQNLFQCGQMNGTVQMRQYVVADVRLLCFWGGVPCVRGLKLSVKHLHYAISPGFSQAVQIQHSAIPAIPTSSNTGHICWWLCGEIGNFIHWRGGDAKRTLKHTWAVSEKPRRWPRVHSRVRLLNMCPTDLKMSTHTKTCTQMCISALLWIHPQLEMINMSFHRWGNSGGNFQHGT